MEWKKIVILFAAGTFCASLGAFELGKVCKVYAPRQYRNSAQEFTGYLSRLYGGKYEIDAKGKGPGITFIEDKKGPMIEVKVSGDSLVFTGRRPDWAAMDFLERECGVRWLWPGDLGTVVPKKQKPKTLKDGEYRFEPPFELRLTQSFHYALPQMTEIDRNNMANWLVHRKVGSAFAPSFGHAFEHIMPRSQYTEKHPEYYALISPANWIGEPKPTAPRRAMSDTGVWQVCTSNSEVRQIFAETAAKQKKGRMQSISPRDGLGFCECDACKAQDVPGVKEFPVTDRMYDFLNDVALRTKKLNPDARIGFFSYSAYAGTPVRIKKLPDNVYLSLCYLVIQQRTPEEQKALDDKIRNLGKLAKIVGREYWGTHYFHGFPIHHSTLIEHNLKLLHEVKAGGIYGETGNDFAVRASDLYILAKMSWDPALNRDDLLKDFCDSAFGDAGKLMYEYFDSEERAFIPAYRKGLLDEHPMKQYMPGFYVNTVRVLSHYFNEDWGKKALGKLQKAKAKAKLPEQKARIDFFIHGVERSILKSKYNFALADLASCGVMLPLVQPSGKAFPMEKKQLLKRVKDTLAARSNLVRFHLRYDQQNAFSGFGITSEERLSLRPWRAVAEFAELELGANRFNYLVNGAFEYKGWEWDIKAENGASFEFSAANNHDAPENFMARCHNYQGIGLKVTLPPGAKLTAENLRLAENTEPVKAKCSFWQEGNIAPVLSVNGTPLENHWVNKGLDAGPWKEMRCTALPLKTGKYKFSFTLENKSSKEEVVWLDDLRLLLDPVL